MVHNEPANASVVDQKIVDETIERIAQLKQSPATVSTGTVQIYTNIAFKYLFEYPSNVALQTTAEMDPDVFTSKSIELFVPGHALLIGVDILESPKTLADFAVEVRNWQVDDINPNIPSDRLISDLKKTIIGGRDAFSFDLSVLFHSPNHGYTLGDNNVYTYVITEGVGDYKYIFRYLNGDEQAKKIFDSISFTN